MEAGHVLLQDLGPPRFAPAPVGGKAHRPQVEVHHDAHHHRLGQSRDLLAVLIVVDVRFLLLPGDSLPGAQRSTFKTSTSSLQWQQPTSGSSGCCPGAVHPINPAAVLVIADATAGLDAGAALELVACKAHLGQAASFDQLYLEEEAASPPAQAAAPHLKPQSTASLPCASAAGSRRSPTLAWDPPCCLGDSEPPKSKLVPGLCPSALPPSAASQQPRRLRARARRRRSGHVHQLPDLLLLVLLKDLKPEMPQMQESFSFKMLEVQRMSEVSGCRVQNSAKENLCTDKPRERTCQALRAGNLPKDCNCRDCSSPGHHNKKVSVGCTACLRCLPNPPGQMCSEAGHLSAPGRNHRIGRRACNPRSRL